MVYLLTAIVLAVVQYTFTHKQYIEQHKLTTRTKQLTTYEIYLFVKLLFIPLLIHPQWLRCCATNRKVAGSIPDGVIGIFH